MDNTIEKDPVVRNKTHSLFGKISIIIGFVGTLPFLNFCLQVIPNLPSNQLFIPLPTGIIGAILAVIGLVRNETGLTLFGFFCNIIVAYLPIAYWRWFPVLFGP
jgi:hypothetical protein